MAGDAPLLDFTALTRRLRTLVAIVGALAGVGVVVEAVLGAGIVPAAVRWATGAAVVVVLGTAVLVALQAYGAADTAQRRGERLSADDVGLVPPRREREGP